MYPIKKPMSKVRIHIRLKANDQDKIRLTRYHTVSLEKVLAGAMLLEIKESLYVGTRWMSKNSSLRLKNFVIF